MFDVWTEFALGGKAGSLRRRPFKKRTNPDDDSNRINVCDNTYIDLLNFRSGEAPDRDERKKQLLPEMRKLRDRIPKMRMAAGLSRTDRVDVLMLKAPALGNAAVFMLDAWSLSRRVTERGRPRGNEIRYTTDSDSLTVIVFPLSFYAYAMRQMFKYYGWGASDFRLLLHYSMLPTSDDPVEIARALKQMDYRKSRFPMEDITNTGIQATTKRDFIVYRGEILHYRDYCLQCKQRIGWATRTCRFGLYNCVLGTDLEPHMRHADDPDYAAFFGRATREKPSTCMAKEKSQIATASLLAVRDGPESVGRNISHEKSEAERRAVDRRLVKSTCKLCVLGDRDTWCQRAPGPTQCSGPFLPEDVEEALVNLRPDPWELHTFLVSGTCISHDRVAAKIDRLNKAKRTYTYAVVRPISPAVLRSSAKKEFASAPLSKAAVSSKRWVMLAPTTGYPIRRVYIDYAEMCELIDEPEADSWKDVVARHPQVANFSPRVWFGLRWEISRINSKHLPVRYSISENLVVRRTRGPINSYILDLSANLSYDICNKAVALSDKRLKENAELIAVAGAKRRLSVDDARGMLRVVKSKLAVC